MVPATAAQKYYRHYIEEWFVSLNKNCFMKTGCGTDLICWPQLITLLSKKIIKWSVFSVNKMGEWVRTGICRPSVAFNNC